MLTCGLGSCAYIHPDFLAKVRVYAPWQLALVHISQLEAQVRDTNLCILPLYIYLGLGLGSLLVSLSSLLFYCLSRVDWQQEEKSPGPGEVSEGLLLRVWKHSPGTWAFSLFLYYCLGCCCWPEDEESPGPGQKF